MRPRLIELSHRLGQLSERSLELWLRVGLDPLGGAYGFLDRRWVPVWDEDAAPRGPSGEVRGDQSLVQQARHLYAYSLWAERRPESALRTEPLAHALFRHLIAAFHRPARRAFVQLRSRRGLVRSDAVELYAQGFAVFALATYGRVFASAPACELALGTFVALDARRHDDEHSGYDQTDEDHWLASVSAPAGAAKCTNTHIHTLEAVTALARAAPGEPLVLGRLRELVECVTGRIFQVGGYLHPFFDRAWRPVGPRLVSYGHDIETAWLVLDALDVLWKQAGVDETFASGVRTAALQMGSQALRAGWDPAGGLCDRGLVEAAPAAGTPEPSRVIDRSKVWWAQAEALPGAYRLFRLAGDVAFLDRLEQTLDFFTERSWDAEHGGFFWSVDSNGTSLERGDHKGEIWKTPYHDLRACVLTADWMAEDWLADWGG